MVVPAGNGSSWWRESLKQSPVAGAMLIVVWLFLQHLDRLETRQHEVIREVSIKLDRVSDRLESMARLTEKNLETAQRWADQVGGVTASVTRLAEMIAKIPTREDRPR